MRRPGAISEARYMADALYIIKMNLLSSQLQLSDEDAEGIRKMAVFVALFYAPYFLRAELASSAAWDDLCYFREMVSLSELPDYRGIAEAVIKSLQRHTTYMEPSALVFSLFSDDVPAK